jgi:hypothetical protein
LQLGKVEWDGVVDQHDRVRALNCPDRVENLGIKVGVADVEVNPPQRKPAREHCAQGRREHHLNRKGTGRRLSRRHRPQAALKPAAPAQGVPRAAILELAVQQHHARAFENNETSPAPDKSVNSTAQATKKVPQIRVLDPVDPRGMRKDRAADKPRQVSKLSRCIGHGPRPRGQRRCCLLGDVAVGHQVLKIVHEIVAKIVTRQREGHGGLQET